MLLGSSCSEQGNAICVSQSRGGALHTASFTSSTGLAALLFTLPSRVLTSQGAGRVSLDIKQDFHTLLRKLGGTCLYTSATLQSTSYSTCPPHKEAGE